MKAGSFCLRVAVLLCVLLLGSVSVHAITFTNNASISYDNPGYDGLDVVISNCTLTVDGAHTFASLLVANGGALTHTYAPGGVFATNYSVADEAQVLNGSNPATLLHTNYVSWPVYVAAVTDAGKTVTYTNGPDYVLTLVAGGWTQMARTPGSTIPDGATVLVTYTAGSILSRAGLNLAVAGNLTVAAGGAINVNGAGYGYYNGLGVGASAGNPQDGSGGGYGGLGGMSSSNAVGGMSYGSFDQPVDLGSPGGISYAGYGGPGGGAVKIVAGGVVAINGVISADGANGTNSRSGGGSGGSIWITAATVTGQGTLSANGGAGEPVHGGGGGGGRIAIQSGANSFAGTLSAYGGVGAKTGGAGTVYTKLDSQNGMLVLDNGGRIGTNTLLAVTNGVDVLVRSNASVMPSGAWTVGNLTVSWNGLIVCPTLSVIDVTATNVTILPSGGVVADLAGYGPGAGQGAGQYFNDSRNRPCGGAGHGGAGANGSATNTLGCSFYGTQWSPETSGSGGGTFPPYSIGGAGGGRIKLTVEGLLRVDGRISANGGNGSGSGGGGGSGGSIWLTAGILMGAGSVSANGGNGVGLVGGGGGGGRVAVFQGTAAFGGTMTAYGGGGANWGGAGTVLFMQSTGESGQLVLDNAGHSGTNTLIQSSYSIDLDVRGGAVGAASTMLGFANVLVRSNGWLSTYYPNYSYLLNVAANGNIVIEAGGGLVMDGAGYGAGVGYGAGRGSSSLPYYACSGAGHGGYGGLANSNTPTGGNAYDLVNSASMPGSGGGSYTTYSSGGAGGGVIQLIAANGTVRVDGRVSAKGGSGSGMGGGGGAGGSVWLTASNLTGSGSITADGGSGADTIGGGGGGGRIALFLSTNTFAGSISAFGGGGANWGGAGTLFFGKGQNSGYVLLDNGGHLGTNTPLQSPVLCDLAVQNGAIAAAGVTTPLSFANVLVASNGWIVVNGVSQGAASRLAFSAQNTVILAGGGIIVDNLGYPAGQGNGPGSYSYGTGYPCGGAGHGGYGARGGTNEAPGGLTYDTTVYPNLQGSGGGTYSPYSIGGPGGGVVQLTVSGSLQVDGKISANGGNGSGSGGGGGSGGSIWLTVGSLTGSGSVSANGGSGVGTIGGGAGGGRIAVSFSTNTFSGNFQARGGGGANYGGAGTVYLKQNQQTYGQLILDNGGHSGTNTTVDVTGVDLVVSGNASAQWKSSGILRNLRIGANSLVAANSATFTVTGDATIDAGGAISVDGAGYAAGTGPGAGGRLISGYSGGGGHGGYGALNGSGKGGSYDVIQTPLMAGSGGNPASSAPSIGGGSGGGIVSLGILGALTVNGSISANGTAGDINGGGGAGGSVWITAGTLSGSGTISANGGAGSARIGGGGAGGRISLQYNTNSFTGLLSAYGGGGLAVGGAGTIYTKANTQSTAQVLVDNGGPLGTNTPVPAFATFDLTVQNGAVVHPSNDYFILNNLVVNDGGWLTCLQGQTNLNVSVLSNVLVAANGAIAVDGMGFAQTNGPGAGSSVSGYGSGGGYGGDGGASATVQGGAAYGSATQPANLGSGGGLGYGPLCGGSQGGGAIRLSVGGTLTVNGWLSAMGAPGLQDNSGGGSGGSIWVTAGALAGNGIVTADGASGDLYGGGGGGGGRIAVYRHSTGHRTNNFTGLISAFGGEGYSWGDDGSVFVASDQSSLQVLSHSPSGVVSNGVDSMDFNFNAAVNSGSLSVSNFSLNTPIGPVSISDMTVSILSPELVRVYFPLQTALGAYTLTAGPQIQDLYGQPMAQAYAATFTISIPAISGTVTDINGQPVPGVVLQPDNTFAAVTTDSQGHYAIGVLTGAYYFSVIPSKDNLVFVPGARSYSGITGSITNQDYIAVSTIAAEIRVQPLADSMVLTWRGIPGVTYVWYYSLDLITWYPYSDGLAGVNGDMSFTVPLNPAEKVFFRVRSSN